MEPSDEALVLARLGRYDGRGRRLPREDPSGRDYHGRIRQ